MVGGVGMSLQIRGHILRNIGRVVRPAHTQCGPAAGGEY